MKLTILGSGTFFIDKVVTSSSFLLEVDKKKILIDCGPGTLVKLARAGISIKDLDYVFITHYHSDHTSDLFPLFMSFRLMDLFEPENLEKFPEFYGPVGIDKFLLDHSRTIEMEAYEEWEKIKVNEYNGDIKLGKLLVKQFKVKHEIFGVMARGYSLRFEHNGKTLSISGDTVDCEGVRESSKGVDLFLCDASFPKGMPNKAHMTTEDIGKIARDSNVGEVLMYHLYPQYADVDLVSEIKENYEGAVRKVKDLEVIEI